MSYWFFVVPLISAIVGWFGAWVAIRILVYRILPARKDALASNIARSVSAEFSMEDIERKIVDPENVKKIMPVVEEHVDDFLRNKLKEKMPVVSMFIGDKTINNLKEVFLKEIEDLFPRVLKQFSANLQSQFNIETLVEGKITSVSAAQVETALSPAFKYWRLCAGITGFVIGLINVFLIIIVK